MEIKKFLQKAKSVNKNAFGSAKIWKSEALIKLAEEMKISVEDDKKLRRVLRKIREALINSVLANEKNSEKEFLEFMQDFLVSETSNFQVESLLSGRTISSANDGDAKAKLVVEKTEKALKQVEKYFNTQRDQQLKKK